MKTDSRLLGYARELRRNMTRQERRLWFNFLRGHPVKVYKQRPIGLYIVDFYCPAARLVIELDGGQHFEAAGIAGDLTRDRYLSEQGLRVLRFSNLDVDQNFGGVCAAIAQCLAPGSEVPQSEDWGGEEAVL